MTGGQSALALDMNAARGSEAATGSGANAPTRAPGVTLTVPAATAEELRQHEAMLDLIHKASGGKAVWRAGAVPDGDGTHRNH
jgi:hypothetical protein